MRKITNANISFVVVILFLSSSIAQKNGDVDHPGNYDAPAHEYKDDHGHQHYDFYIPGNENKKDPKGSGGSGGNSNDDVPAPSPVEDHKNNSGDGKSRNDGSGNSNGGTDGTGSQNSKSEQKFDRIIEQKNTSSSSDDSTGSSPSKTKSDSSHGDHRGDDHGHQSTRTSNNQSSYPNQDFQELIKKGKKASEIIVLRSLKIKEVRNQKIDELVSIRDNSGFQNVENLYQSDQKLIDLFDQKKLEVAFYDYSKFNIASRFIPFHEILFQTDYNYQKYRKELAEKELNAIFPGVREKNIAGLLKAREMIRN